MIGQIVEQTKQLLSIWVQITHCKFMDTNTLHKPPIHFKDMSWFNRCIVFCGVGFGSGLAPKAPGTFGSAFALLLFPSGYLSDLL